MTSSIFKGRSMLLKREQANTNRFDPGASVARGPQV
jgi:hypothetical protein